MMKYNPITCMMEEAEKCKPLVKDSRVKDVSSDQVARDLKNLASVVTDAMKSFSDAEDKDDKKRMRDNIKMLKIQQKRLSKIDSDLEFVITHLEDLI